MINKLINMTILETSRLSKTYVDEEVLTYAIKHIDFKLEKSEFVAIMGPSGSGKSTLLHILGLLDTPSDGKYFLMGEDTSKLSGEELALLRNKKMGFVFQSFNLMPKFSVFDNVKLPLYYSDVPDKLWDDKVREAVKAVDLSDRLYYKASQLSGGEKQRVAIARALVNDPEIIFADEPTGNLDSKSGQIVMSILERLNDEFGRTVILITHESYTAGHAKRIVRLWDGEVQSDERVAERHKASKEFFK